MKSKKIEKLKDMISLIIVFVLGGGVDYYLCEVEYSLYELAFENLKGYIGIIMTVVSMLFSTYINFIQRLEKNPFGITYKEMQENEQGLYMRILRFTRMVSYVTPFMLIIVINLRLCIVGYMLYVFCWFSVFLQFYSYIESFKREKVPGKVVKVILKSLPDTVEWRDKDVQKLDIRLSDMLINMGKAGNWFEIDLIFKALFIETANYDMRKKVLLFEHFCSHLCTEQKDKPLLIYRIWNLYLFLFNQKESSDNDMGYVCFWGMIQGIMPYIHENNICKLIDDMLDIRRQGIEVCANEMQKANRLYNNQQLISKQNVGLDLQKVRMRSAMLLVLLEDRFETLNFKTKEIAERIFRLEKYGDAIFSDKEICNLKYIIFNSETDAFQQKRIQVVVHKLLMDKEHRWHRCFVNRYIDIKLNLGLEVDVQEVKKEEKYLSIH